VKRFWIILLAAAMALSLLLVAAAAATPPKEFCDDKPDDHRRCTTTTPTITVPEPQFEPCAFSLDGALEGWDGESLYRCIWEELDLAQPFAFEIRAAQPSAATQVVTPHLVVLGFSDAESDRDICINEHQTGPQDLPYPQDGRWTLSLADCAANYLVVLEISVQKAKKGPVDLVWTDMPG
jgi:hypothetical protein